METMSAAVSEALGKKVGLVSGLCLVQSLLPEQPTSWKNRPLADPGFVMSILLVPTLFQSLAYHDPMMLAYAKCTSLLLCVPKMMAGSMLPVQLQVLLLALIHYSGGNVCLLFVVSWWVLNSYLTPLLSGILTWGEFRVLLASASVAVTEWMVETATATTASTTTSRSTISASYIALSGAVGCAVSIFLAKNKLSFTYKLLVQVVGPFVFSKAACGGRIIHHLQMPLAMGCYCHSVCTGCWNFWNPKMDKSIPNFTD
jgi:hypothetical protein